MRIFSIQRVFALLLNIFYHSGGKRNKIVHLKTSAGRIVRHVLHTLRNKKGTFTKRTKSCTSKWFYLTISQLVKV